MDSLPKQYVPGYAFARRKQQEAEEAAKHEANLKILEGGQDVTTDMDAVQKGPKVFNYRICETDSREEYLEKAKLLPLTDNNVNAFFREEGLKFSFGQQTEHLVRLGFDDMNKVWKIYLKRENPNFKPSILGFLATEVNVIAEYILRCLGQIEEGLANKQPFLKPDDLKNWKLEQPTDNIGFWQHEDCFYTDSGHSRMRLMWQMGNVYMMHLNQVNEPGPKCPNNFGPKVRLTRKEMLDFANICKKIQERTGPLENLA